MDVATADNIVLQTFEDGRYCSGLLAGRYQIFESSFYEGQFTIFDHKTQEVIRSKTSEYFRLFNSVEEAEVFLGVKANSVPALTNTKTRTRSKANSATNSARAKTVKRLAGELENKMVAKSAPRVRGESALGYLKSLLLTNSDLGDKEIAKMVQEKFPECTYNHSMVKYNRKKMGG
jgi:hypothetical protein